MFSFLKSKVSAEEIDAKIALVEKAIEEGDLEQARKVAKTLQHLKSPQGYFYEAQVLATQGRYPYALDVTKDGLKLDPKSGPLLLQYARYCFVLGHLRECASAVEKAVTVGNINPISAGLLLAELRVAQGHPSEALTLLRGFDLSDSDIDEKLAVQDHIVTTLIHLEQYEMAMDALTTVEVTPEASPYRRARMLLWEAVVWNEGRKNPEKAMELARQAFLIDPMNPEVLNDVRQILNLGSTQARVFQMTTVGPNAFQAVYVVLADGPEQALGFIKDLEPSEIADGLEVTQIGEFILDPEELEDPEKPIILGVLKIESRFAGVK